MARKINATNLDCFCKPPSEGETRSRIKGKNCECDLFTKSSTTTLKIKGVLSVEKR